MILGVLNYIYCHHPLLYEEVVILGVLNYVSHSPPIFTLLILLMPTTLIKAAMLSLNATSLAVDKFFRDINTHCVHLAQVQFQTSKINVSHIAEFSYHMYCINPWFHSA